MRGEVSLSDGKVASFRGDATCFSFFFFFFLSWIACSLALRAAQQTIFFAPMRTSSPSACSLKIVCYRFLAGSSEAGFSNMRSGRCPPC